MPKTPYTPPPITAKTSIEQFEATVILTTHPMASDPAVFPPHLAALSLSLGEVAGACDRRFTLPDDRAETERKLGLAFLLLTQVAHAGGTTLPRSIEAFRAWKRAQQQAAKAAKAAKATHEVTDQA